MKALIRIPTTQYGYFECEFEGTEQEIIEKHNELLKRYNGGFGLEQKEWNAALDRYRKDRVISSDAYDAMSREQQWCIQEIKKSFKRLEK